jgi:hypothetical protein
LRTRDFFQSLKTRHRFGEWRGTTRLEENLFVWHLLLPADQFSAFTPHRIQRVDVAGWPPMIQSVWRLAGAPDERVLLQLDAFECPSRDAAHDLLVRLLGYVQSPLVERDETAGVGDVVFSSPGLSALLFARANVVLVMRNAGRTIISVRPFAVLLDADLVSKPESAAAPAGAPEIRRFDLQRAPKGGLAALQLEAADPARRELMYKLFSRSGEVFREDDRLLYRSSAPGAQEIEIYATAVDGRATTEARLRFDLT